MNNDRLKKQLIKTLGIALIGFLLGLLQKWIDGLTINIFPEWFQQLDIGNYFGRFAIWIFLGTLISIKSSSPIRASINVFVFLISMLIGYYLYGQFVLGFLPQSYMMMWVIISFLSIPMATITWYAKDKGRVGLFLSSLILGVLLAQAVSISFDQGFYVYHWMEVFTYLVGLVMLYRSPKDLPIQFGLSIVVAFLYQLIIPYWG